MKKVGNVIAIVLLAISIFVFIKGNTFPGAQNGAPGPGFFPMMLACLLAGLCILELLVSKKMKETEEDATRLFSKENAKVWVSLGITVGYLLLIALIGFIFATIVYLFVMFWYYKIRNKIVLCLVPVGTSIFLYTVFTVLLKVQLPHGIFI